MDILKIKMQENDAKAATIGEYLKTLLAKIWTDGEGFSGKRPFGNSGWEYDVYEALVSARAVEGVIDDYGDIVSCNTKSADEIILKAINEVFA